MFQRFYLLVLGYIYLTRILVFLMLNTVPFRYVWLAYFIDEIITLAFYVRTGSACLWHAVASRGLE